MDMFKNLYAAHRERLFGYLLRKSGNYHLTTDIVQESFTRYLEQYANKGDNPALLFTIGRNLLLDHIRKNKATVSYEDNEHGQAVDQEHNYQIREEFEQVLAAMQQLGEEERDILAMVASSGLSYREIANVTGNNEANIKVKVHRARVKLKHILKGYQS